MIDKGVKKQELVTYVVSKWERLKRERTDKEARWNECIDAYMGQIAADSDVKEYRSQRPSSMAFEAVENVTALIGVGLFPNDRFIMAIGENPDAEATADKRTRFMQNRLEKMQYVEKYVGQHLKQLAVVGNSVRLVKWNKRQSRRKVSSYEFMGKAMAAPQAMPPGPMGMPPGPMGMPPGPAGMPPAPMGMPPAPMAMQQPVPKTYKKPDNEYDGPDFDVLDIFNYVHDPKQSDLDAKVKIYRTKVSKGDLLADAEDGIYDKKAVQRAIDGGGGKDEPSDSDEEARFQAFGVQRHKKDADEEDVELLWCHGDFPVGAKGKNEVLRDKIVVIANRSELIRCEDNPLDCGLSPLRYTGLVPVIGMDWALGLLEANLGLYDLINVHTNQAVDAGSLNLNGMWAYKEGSVNPDDLISRPGNTIPMEDPQTDLKPLVPSMDFLQIYGIVEGFKQEFVDATFSWKSAGAQKDQTATASAITANLQGAVMRRVSQRLENIDIEPDLKMFDEMEQQFFDPYGDAPYARFEQDGVQQYEQITPDIIYQNYTWKCNGSGEAQFRQLQQQGHFQWGIAVAQTPAMGGVDWMEWGKEGLRLMGHRAIDRIMPGLEKMGPQNAQAAAIQQALSGAAPMPPGSRNPEGSGPNGRGPSPNAGGAANALDSMSRIGRMGG